MSLVRIASRQMGARVRGWSAMASSSSSLMDGSALAFFNPQQQQHQTVHHFSSSASGSGGGFPRRGGPRPFKPRRRPPKNYEPFESKEIRKRRSFVPKKTLHVGKIENARTELEATYGLDMAHHIEGMRSQRRVEALLARNDPNNETEYDEVEEGIRVADYMTTEDGSTEAAIFERRVREQMSEEELEEFDKWSKESIRESERRYLQYEDMSYRKDLKPPKERYSKQLKEFLDGSEEARLYGWNEDDPENRYDPNCSAFGPWSEYLVSVNRGTHNWRGGRLESYRAMVVGGNGNGCAGFAVGKGNTALAAIQQAARKSRQNIFFLDRFMGERLTRDLVGKHNSCKVVIRSTVAETGLRGNIMVREILKRFGIAHAHGKAHGKRRPVWNVVYATFKALCTHESLEDICRKRGQRFVPVERALRSRT